MPFDTAGNFTRSYNWQADRDAGIKIEAARMDGEFNNFAAAMNQVLLKNGTSPALGNLNMGGYDIVNLNNAATSTNPAISFSQDPKTGIYSPAAGSITILSGGTGMIMVTPTGVSIPTLSGPSSVPTGGLTLGSNTNLTGGQLTLNGSGGAGGFRGMVVETAGVLRWLIAGDGSTESGSNVGTNFIVQRYDDTGNSLGQALTIQRNTGAAAFSSALNVGGIITGAANIVATTPGQLVVNGPAGQQRYITIQTATAPRWTLSADTTAESGSNAGSNFYIGRWSDGSVLIDNPIAIGRASGVVNFSQIPTHPSPTKAFGNDTRTQSATMQALAQHGISLGGFVAASGAYYPGAGNTGDVLYYTVNTTNSCYLPGGAPNATITLINASGTTVGIAGISTPPAYNTVPNGAAIVMGADTGGTWRAVATAGYGSVGRVTETDEDTYTCNAENYFDGNCIHFNGSGHKRLVWEEDLLPGARLEVSCDPGATVEFAYAGTARAVPINRTSGISMRGPGEAVITQKKLREIWLKGDIR